MHAYLTHINVSLSCENAKDAKVAPFWSERGPRIVLKNSNIIIYTPLQGTIKI